MAEAQHLSRAADSPRQCASPPRTSTATASTTITTTSQSHTGDENLLDELRHYARDSLDYSSRPTSNRRSVALSSAHDGTLSTAAGSADTMSVTAASFKDLPRCLRCIPTGKQCLRFYFVMLLTLLISLMCIVILVSGAVSDQKDLECTFQTLLATCVAFWLQPPTLH